MWKILPGGADKYKMYYIGSTSLEFPIKSKAHCEAYWKHMQPMFEAFGADVFSDEDVVEEVLREHDGAVTIWFPDKIKVIYDKSKPNKDVYFSLAHELGHIALDHNNRFEKSIGLYNIMEHEADLFAYGLLNLISKLEGLQ